MASFKGALWDESLICISIILGLIHSHIVTDFRF